MKNYLENILENYVRNEKKNLIACCG